MSPERFRALAEAFGGDPDRWPLEARDAARQHIRLHPDAQQILDGEAKLDGMLSTWTVPGPGAVLAAQIAAATVRKRAYTRRLRLWLSSLGAATALAGGIAAGALTVALSQPASQDATAPLYELQVLGEPLRPDGPSQ